MGKDRGRREDCTRVKFGIFPIRMCNCGMSALGHKRTFCDAGAMSALPPKADIDEAK